MESKNRFTIQQNVATGYDCRERIFVVDAEDVERMSRHRWCVDTNGYVCTKIDGKKTLLHRFVVEAKCGEEVDHINHERHDCRKANLRTCARIDNAKNRPRQCNNKSGYKGVGWHRKSGKWRARIRIHGKQCELGYFDTPEEAHRKYCEAAIRAHGEFMCAG